MDSKYLIIADDFTGANDTGVQMSKRGVDTEVSLFPNEDVLHSSIVLDTESRNLSGNDSYDKVSKTVQTILKNNHFNLVYKKIDSTLRGNVVEELQAVVETYKPEKIIFAPAYPQIGRTTLNQIHFVNDERLKDTEFANDPLKPILIDDINRMLIEGLNEKVTHHGIDDIRNGELSLIGSKYHTFDSVVNEDLHQIVSNFIHLDEKILWVGSAGLANAIFKELYPMKPSMAVVGSISQVSFDQMNYAAEKGKKILSIPIEDIFNKVNIDKYVNEAIKILNTNQDIIITAARSRKDYSKTLELGKQKNLNDDDSSWYVQNYLGEITNKLLYQYSISGLFLTGGSTAISVIDKLNGSGCIIESEVMTGIVYSKLVGGNFQGLNLITKAGAFGDKTSLFKSLNLIKEL